jgi:hypothetical protein
MRVHATVQRNAPNLAHATVATAMVCLASQILVLAVFGNMAAVAITEAVDQGMNNAPSVDTRFIVTNLEGGRPKQLYQALYGARGQAENHIMAWKNHLAGDRTSCHQAEANQCPRARPRPAR